MDGITDSVDVNLRTLLEMVDGARFWFSLQACDDWWLEHRSCLAGHWHVPSYEVPERGLCPFSSWTICLSLLVCGQC